MSTSEIQRWYWLIENRPYIEGVEPPVLLPPPWDYHWTTGIPNHPDHPLGEGCSEWEDYDINWKEFEGPVRGHNHEIGWLKETGVLAISQVDGLSHPIQYALSGVRPRKWLPPFTVLIDGGSVTKDPKEVFHFPKYAHPAHFDLSWDSDPLTIDDPIIAYWEGHSGKKEPAARIKPTMYILNDNPVTY
jgi:hypothetical protein